MRRIILITWLLSAVAGTFAQRDYYIGIPFHEAYMKDSDRIVLDMLPWNPNGRLDEVKMPRYMEPLKQFLAEHPGLKCNIHLYGDVKDEEQNLGYTAYKAKRLQEYFTYVDTLFGREYLNDIVPHSTWNPLFKNLEPDSSNRIYKGKAAFYLRSCVIVELIQPQPVSWMVQMSLFSSHPIDACGFDIAPSFPGGSEAFYKFLLDRIDYSAVGQFDVTGTVAVEFEIDSTGQVREPVLVRQLFPALDEQALQIVGEMPRWIPATKDCYPVSCRYCLLLFYSI